MIEIKTIKIETPKDSNTIIGTTHFILSVEDMHEALVKAVPGIKFGLAFCEASGPCLVRKSGTDKELEEAAAREALKLSCGHAFIIFLGKGFYPLNILNAIKNLPEVCCIHCASANPVEAIIAETETGRALLGIVDGAKSKGIETEADAKERKEFLRKIGYKH